MKVIFIVLFTKKSWKKICFHKKQFFKIYNNKKNVLSSISAY